MATHLCGNHTPCDLPPPVHRMERDGYTSPSLPERDRVGNLVVLQCFKCQ